jgi:hypothetical protein
MKLGLQWSTVGIRVVEVAWEGGVAVTLPQVVTGKQARVPVV